MFSWEIKVREPGDAQGGSEPWLHLVLPSLFAEAATGKFPEKMIFHKCRIQNEIQASSWGAATPTAGTNSWVSSGVTGGTTPQASAGAPWWWQCWSHSPTHLFPWQR